MATADLTAQRLREILSYDPQTGVFHWRMRVGRSRTTAGDVAGHLSPHGYWLIKIDQVKWPAHRLAYLYMTGEHPQAQIDHRNKNRQDNRWDNLRPATSKQNHENRVVHEMRGIRWEQDRQKWLVRIKSFGITLNLGRFECLDEAIAARRAAERVHFTHSPACD